MATVKRTATIHGFYIELGNKDIEIYSIATDGSGRLKRVDDPERVIREIGQEVGFQRDYNISYRQHVAKLILHINKIENNK